MADTNRVIGFSGEVMDISNAAVVPKNQLGSQELSCC